MALLTSPQPKNSSTHSWYVKQKEDADEEKVRAVWEFFGSPQLKFNQIESSYQLNRLSCKMTAMTEKTRLLLGEDLLHEAANKAFLRERKRFLTFTDRLHAACLAVKKDEITLFGVYSFRKAKADEVNPKMKPWIKLSVRRSLPDGSFFVEERLGIALNEDKTCIMDPILWDAFEGEKLEEFSGRVMWPIIREYTFLVNGVSLNEPWKITEIERAWILKEPDYHLQPNHGVDDVKESKDLLEMKQAAAALRTKRAREAIEHPQPSYIARVKFEEETLKRKLQEKSKLRATLEMNAEKEILRKEIAACKKKILQCRLRCKALEKSCKRKIAECDEDCKRRKHECNVKEEALAAREDAMQASATARGKFAQVIVSCLGQQQEAITLENAVILTALHGATKLRLEFVGADDTLEEMLSESSTWKALSTYRVLLSFSNLDLPHHLVLQNGSEFTKESVVEKRSEDVWLFHPSGEVESAASGYVIYKKG